MRHNWYYRIETEPGVYTPGDPIATVGAIKDIYRKIDFSGVTALDIGTQEFVNPILMRRHGAERVVAYDRLSLTDEFDMLKSVYDLDRVDYLHGMSINDLRQTLNDKKLPRSFDFVNFTGVLYHMIDPLGGMAVARSFLREGGLMLLETSVLAKPGKAVDFNRAGRYYPHSNYFQFSPNLIAYWSRMLRLHVEDALWLGGEKIKRLFLVLRASSEVEAPDSDKWIRRPFVTNDFKPYDLNYRRLESDKSPVGYTPINSLVYTRTSPRMVDVAKTLRRNPMVNGDAYSYRKQLVARETLKVSTNIKRCAHILRGSTTNHEIRRKVARDLNEQVDAKFNLTRRNSLNFEDL